MDEPELSSADMADVCVGKQKKGTTGRRLHGECESSDKASKKFDGMWVTQRGGRRGVGSMTEGWLRERIRGGTGRRVALWELFQHLGC